jgi:manganese oxidase
MLKKFCTLPASSAYHHGIAAFKWICISVALLASGCASLSSVTHDDSLDRSAFCNTDNTVNAEVVALEQAYVLNRFGAYVPAGMMYALKRDVVAVESDRPAGPGNAKLRNDKRPRPLVLRAHEGGCLQVTLHNWLSPTWEEEGGQPHYPTMLLDGKQVPAAPAHMGDADGVPTSRNLRPLSKSDKDAPRTRSASLYVTGLESDRIGKNECPTNAVCGGDGSYVGLPGQQGTVVNDATAPEMKQRYQTGSLIPPGGISVIRWIARKEGTFFAHSMGAPVGGEGDGGQIGLGLFAAVNVEPTNSKWYRSQLTHEEMQSAMTSSDGIQHPYATVNYETRKNGSPVMAILEGKEIVHSDLNAVIVRTEKQRARCTERLKDTMVDGQRCEPAFREFTVILHDEVHAQQAFRELEDESSPLHYLKDGMGINYGVSSMGSLLLAAGPQRGVGPAAKCPECRAEEFFLSSWANGDPALVLQWDEKGEKPIGARYPDDPSNVHHSYLGDPVVFRNLHAGPKETHVFHLHAHQWVLDASDPNSTYLDSQTISPGATFSYGIEFGGSGNRNFTPGDSIFHCHLYPHFAQGMWELWRVHDVFENGLHLGQYGSAAKPGFTTNAQSRSLPDAEVLGGIATPAIVPLPGIALAPMPSAEFRGYPFYIPGEPGHRPPQPALDMDVVASGYSDPAAYATEPAQADIVNGGLPRHVITGGTLKSLNKLKTSTPDYKEVLDAAITKGGLAAQVLAQKVYSDFPLAFQALAADWESIVIKPLMHSGEPDEKKAMEFHEGNLKLIDRTLAQGKLEPVAIVQQPRPQWWTHSSGYRTSFAPTVSGMATTPSNTSEVAVFRVNGRGRAPGSPYANPCPKDAPTRNYKSAFIQTEITVNKHGWFDPQGRIVILEDDIKDVIDANTRTKMPEPLFFRANSGDCINFKSSNFMPSALNGDDFQIYTPTDSIGQHIHLVKFDVTSSDGSANGWNYEDATFSPDEVRERIVAHNRTLKNEPTKTILKTTLEPKNHPLFKAGGSIFQANALGQSSDLYKKGLCPERKAGVTDHEYLKEVSANHPYCGAQRTTQRWWADPILVRGSSKQATKDNTLRTVFTHDHLGPSSHQQHGLYAALVIEPANSIWQANPFDVEGNTNTFAAKCTTPDLRARAKAAGLVLADRNIAGTDVDDAVHVAFKIRASASMAAQLKEDADGCLKVALLGGSDLSKQPVVLTAEGGKELEPISPRPVLQSRSDGGPTSARAVIISPTCVGDADSSPASFGSVKSCPSGQQANQTRREFGLAFADFAGVYNVALEPINPETPRDVSMRRFGERQVATRASRPIAISSEDPGTQLINYRHEPLALRIADVKWNRALGGFDYSHTKNRVRKGNCELDDKDCLGDMANAFSTLVHARRDRELATQPYWRWVAAQSDDNKPSSELDFPSPRLRQLTPPLEPSKWNEKLDNTLKTVENWRRDFNCALYNPSQWLREAKEVGATVLQKSIEAGSEPLTDAEFNARCAPEKNARQIQQPEPWRYFGDPATPILAAEEGDPIQVRLIQGAQEAQHIFTMNGVKWHRLPDSPNSGFVNAQPIGISEHFEFDIRVPNFKLPFADYLYFGSSVDQLWDGMWGVMRAFNRKGNLGVLATPPQNTTPPTTDTIFLSTWNSRQLMVSDSKRWLRSVPMPRTDAQAAAAWDSAGTTGVCSAYRKDAKDIDIDQLEVRSFDVSAVRACDLTGDCIKRPLTYSQRFGITDPLAVVYVLNREITCTRGKGSLVKDANGQDIPSLTNDGCFDADIRNQANVTDAKMLEQLKTIYTTGRTIEPLVLRAAAGQCITVKLRNHLPIEPLILASNLDAGNVKAVREDAAYHNFLPMITDGFNLNQFKISNVVGISAPRLLQNPVNADGSNAGINSAALLAGSTVVPEDYSPGSLQPPCAVNQPCSRNYVWAARDLSRDPVTNQITSVPVELGALPLRSFGDPIKQPMHGLIGALVIGPEGSKVCDNPSTHSSGVSRKICTSDGKSYGDHVLVMQDAVSAIQHGFPVADLKGAEEPDDYGVKAINYKTEPLWARRGGSPSIEFGDRNANFDYTAVFSSKFDNGVCESGASPIGGADTACDPETGVIKATPGEALRIHFVHPGGHTRQQGLTLAGHGFNPYPWGDGSHVFAPTRCEVAHDQAIPVGCLTWQGVYNGFGPMMAITLGFKAGGTSQLAKDYLLRSQSSFLLDGGLWGILRVKK